MALKTMSLNGYVYKLKMSLAELKDKTVMFLVKYLTPGQTQHPRYVPRQTFTNNSMADKHPHCCLYSL